MPRFGITWEQTGPLDLREIFGNDNPVVLEIGFGAGEALLTGANSEPERNFLGIEVHRPGIGRLLAAAAEQDLQNLRVMRADAISVLRDAIPPGSLSEIRLFFPDPWPKKKHHKRRILNQAFLQLAARALKPGGLLHCATDWQDYAEQMRTLLAADAAHFANTVAGDGYAPRPDSRPLTRFEQRGQRLGHGVWDLLYRRR